MLGFRSARASSNLTSIIVHRSTLGNSHVHQSVVTVKGRHDLNFQLRISHASVDSVCAGRTLCKRTTYAGVLLSKGACFFFRIASSFNTLKNFRQFQCMLAYFGVSVTHRTLTRTTGSFTCVCDLVACVCTHGGRPRFIDSSEGVL